MSSLLVQLALSDLLASVLLAGAAYLVHRHGRYPGLAHLLWVIVLLKLVTPPVLLLPLAPARGSAAPADVAGMGTAAAVMPADGLGPAAMTWLGGHVLEVLLLAWALGSVVVLLVSLLRIRRFDRLLRQTARPAPAAVEALARGVARELGLRRMPSLEMTEASVTPMTWWVGRRPRLVLPRSLVEHMDGGQLRWVLAHELAHVKRHDHLVRWLEWLACVAFWWNPIAWWARRNLRLDEEASCDAYVLEHLERRPRAYASALLTAIELLARPAVHAPAVATGIDGGSLEQRFALIVSGRRAGRTPRGLTVTCLALAALVMPFGIGPGGEGASGADASPALLGPAIGGGGERGGGEQGSPMRMFLSARLPRGAVLDAEVATALEPRDPTRAERALRVAQRKLARAEQALGQAEVEPGQVQRKLKEARCALRRAERVIERSAAVPEPTRRELRAARASVRAVARGLQALRATGG